MSREIPMNFDLFQAVFSFGDVRHDFFTSPSPPQPESIGDQTPEPEQEEEIDFPDIEVPESPEFRQPVAGDEVEQIDLDTPQPDEEVPSPSEESISELSQSPYEPEPEVVDDNEPSAPEESIQPTPEPRQPSPTSKQPTPEPKQVTSKPKPTTPKRKPATPKQTSSGLTKTKPPALPIEVIDPTLLSHSSRPSSNAGTRPSTPTPTATPTQNGSSSQKRSREADANEKSTKTTTLTSGEPPFKRPNVNLSSFAKQLYTRGHNFNFITSTVHLKKPPGEAFTRQDIQLDFMTALFNDETKAFTNYFKEGVFEGEKITFYQLYTRAIAESTSRRVTKLIKAGMLSKRAVGEVVAMLMLMVNAGRMSSRVCFIAQSSSTSSTFNSIPSLQTRPDVGLRFPDSKSFKEIVNIEAKDSEIDQKNIDSKLIQSPPDTKPNINVLVLIHALSKCRTPIPFFGEENNKYPCYVNFLDFFQESLVHPANRAKRFLWLMYTFLETNFTPEEMAKNPFGAEIPEVQLLSSEEAAKFDVDSPAEVAYATEMYKKHAEWSAHVEKAMEEALRLSEEKRLQHIANAKAKEAEKNGKAKR